MKSLSVHLLAPSVCAAAMLLSGCGPSQPPTGMPGAIPQVPANAAHAERDRSWMLPEAKNEDLLYLASSDGVHVLSYPHGKLVGSIRAGDNLSYLCTDANGNVFLTIWKSGDQSSARNVVEFAHGGTTPIARFSSHGWPFSCSVDPVSGNLAVVNQNGPGSPIGSVAIFRKARGNAKIYRDPPIKSYTYGSYDASGDLFIVGVGPPNAYFAELPKGSNTFTNITIDHRWYGSDVVAWDGTYITLADPLQRALLRISVSGSVGTVVHVVKIGDWHDGAMRESLVQAGTTFIARPDGRWDAGLWKYPSGGMPTQVFRTFPRRTITAGITVSVAPKR